MSDETPEAKEAAAKAAENAAAQKAGTGTGTATGTGTKSTPAGKMIEVRIVGSVLHDGKPLPIGKKVNLPAAEAKRLLALGDRIAVKPDAEE